MQEATVTDVEIAGAAAALGNLRAGLHLARTPAEYTEVLDKAAAVERHARRFRAALMKRDLLDQARHAYTIEVEAAFARAEAVVAIAGQLPDGQATRSDLSPSVTSSDFGISRQTAARWKRYRNALGDRDLDVVRAIWLEEADADPAGWEEPSLARILRRARMEDEDTMSLEAMTCPRCGHLTIGMGAPARDVQATTEVRRRCFRCWWPSKATPASYQSSLAESTPAGDTA
jgi:hypothetical protein